MKEPKLLSEPGELHPPKEPPESETPAALPALHGALPAPAPKAMGEFKNALESAGLDRQLALIRELLARGQGGSGS